MLMILITTLPSYLLSLIYGLLEIMYTIVLLSLSTFCSSNMKNYINIFPPVFRWETQGCLAAVSAL